MFKKILLFSLFYVFLIGQDFQPPITISNGDASIYPHISFSRNGITAIAIWSVTKGGIHVIQTSCTKNGGISWQPLQDISLPSEDAQLSDPYVVFKDDETALAIWSSFNGSFYVVRTSITTDGGDSWSTPQDISLNVENAYEPLISFNRDGSKAIVIWNIYESSTHTIKATTTTDGISWTTPTSISPLDIDANNYQLAFGEGDNAIVAWDNGLDETCIVQTTFSSDAGATWNTPNNVTTPGTASQIQVTFGSATDAIIVFAGFDGVDKFNVYTSYTTDGGQNWDTPINVSGYHDVIGGAQVAFGAGDHAIVTWGGFDVGSPFIQTSQTSNGGASWETPITISNPATTVNVGAPQITYGFSQQAVVIWYAVDNGGNYLTQASETFDGGTTWQPPVNISFSETLTQTPQIAVGIPAASNNNNLLPGNTVSEVIIGLWSGQSGSETTTYIRASSTLGQPAFSAYGNQYQINGLWQKDIINKISWTTVPSAVSYTVLGSNNNLLYQGNATTFFEHNKKSGKVYTYYVYWTDSLGDPSPAVQVTIP